MKMKYVRTYRVNPNTVNVVNTFDGVEATVTWVKPDEYENKKTNYFVHSIKSNDERLDKRLNDALKKRGLGCKEEDLEMYLFCAWDLFPPFDDDDDDNDD